MNNSSEIKWFIAQVKPNSYAIASRNLERQGFKIFLPTIDITKRNLNKFSVKNVYLFPGYIFVAFNPLIIFWAKINSTYGISKILVFNGKPAEVPSELILNLKHRCDFNDKLLLNDKIQIGDKIKISNGPFANFIAEVENIRGKQKN